MKKIIGMGNALVDVMTLIPNDGILEKLSLPKGSMQLVDKDVSENIYSSIKQYNPQLAAGGSAANTINGLANLGIPCGFIGKVGKDDTGMFFEKDLITNQITPLLFKGKTETGKAIALVSPDSERTFATFLGAAIELTPEDISIQLFEGGLYFHIEGYLVQNYALIEKAMELAKKAGLKISLDLASYNVVETNLEFLKKITKQYVDILFANEEEAKAFTGKEPREALDIIAMDCEIAIVKIGSKGSLIKSGNTVEEVGVIKAKSIDTTGAGDLYASGFLYGLAKGLTLKACGEIGSLLAGNVIEVIGSKMDNKRWKKIKDQI